MKSGEAAIIGVEQFPMTWKGMLPAYLGLANPIENDAILSVTGQHHVAFGNFQERIDLGNDIGLFLWQGSEGEAVALYTRAAFRQQLIDAIVSK